VASNDVYLNIDVKDMINELKMGNVDLIFALAGLLLSILFLVLKSHLGSIVFTFFFINSFIVGSTLRYGLQEYRAKKEILTDSPTLQHLSLKRHL
jgi:uncharacterized membrane protein